MWVLLRGKKTYLLCSVALLHGVLDWLAVLPARGLFDAGKTTATAEILSALAVMTFRMGLASAQQHIIELLMNCQKQIKVLQDAMEQKHD